ncbi:replication initiator protein A [[Ruminococcus] torques]|nr:replication initiator protein A [[Ruminococcus] torques]
MAFPSFLLDCDFSETTKLLYMVLLNRARLSQKNDGWIDKKVMCSPISPLKIWQQHFAKARQPSKHL